MKPSPVLAGNLAGFVGSCLLGGSVVATRIIVEHIAPLHLAFLRFLIGGACLAAALTLLRRGAWRIPRSALPRIALLGVCMYAALPTLFNSSLQFTTASRGAVILALMPLFTAIYGATSGSERLRRLQLMGVVCSIAGIVVVFAESGLGSIGSRSVILGNTLMVAAAITGATSNLMAKPLLRSLDALPVTALAMLFGAAFLLLPALAQHTVSEVRAAPSDIRLLVLYLSIPGGALGFFLSIYSIARLSVTQATIYINLNPIVATVLGALLLNEPLTRWFGIGFLLVIAGLLMANVPGRHRQQEPGNRPPGSMSVRQ